ncbi:MAG: isochorismatase family protein [Acidobacteriota bacterium]|nr:isochorismatase family protein [Acidobacteriota bacterium]MDQ5837400.1 isochorismatase family protein [Acidobacteriota bacterium]
MNNRRHVVSRREMLGMTAGLSGLALATGASPLFAWEKKRTPARRVTIDAKTEPVAIDTAKTALIVVDMQNDFASEGGMFQRVGRDLSLIQAAVTPTARVLNAVRSEGVRVIYFKMAFKPDLSDAGAPDSVNRKIHLKLAPQTSHKSLCGEVICQIQPHAEQRHGSRLAPQRFSHNR